MEDVQKFFDDYNKEYDKFLLFKHKFFMNFSKHCEKMENTYKKNIDDLEKKTAEHKNNDTVTELENCEKGLKFNIFLKFFQMNLEDENEKSFINYQDLHHNLNSISKHNIIQFTDSNLIINEIKEESDDKRNYCFVKAYLKNLWQNKERLMSFFLYPEQLEKLQQKLTESDKQENCCLKCKQNKRNLIFFRGKNICPNSVERKEHSDCICSNGFYPICSSCTLDYFTNKWKSKIFPQEIEFDKNCDIPCINCKGSLCPYEFIIIPEKIQQQELTIFKKNETVSNELFENVEKVMHEDLLQKQRISEMYTMISQMHSTVSNPVSPLFYPVAETTPIYNNNLPFYQQTENLFNPLIQQQQNTDFLNNHETTTEITETEITSEFESETTSTNKRKRKTTNSSNKKKYNTSNREGKRSCNWCGQEGHYSIYHKNEPEYKEYVKNMKNLNSKKPSLVTKSNQKNYNESPQQQQQQILNDEQDSLNETLKFFY